VMFLDGLNSNAVLRKQVWGLDLAGQSGGAGILPASGIHGAGGIGGLLAAVETQGTYQGTYWYLYDGNGNVTQVLSASSYSVVAHYEYDPYGNAIVATGTYAAANPIRFSTKHWDAVVGLGYWGRRYYRPDTGRWLNRDPIEEEGGDNLYTAMLNDPGNLSDSVGEEVSPCREAKDNGDDKGDGGGVVCKNGKKHFCVWTPPGTNPGIDYCIGQHERDHADAVDCPKTCDNSVTRPPPKSGTDFAAEECSAHKTELQCLMKEKPYRCNKLPKEAREACRKAFDDRIGRIGKNIAKYCASSK